MTVSLGPRTFPADMTVGHSRFYVNYGLGTLSHVTLEYCTRTYPPDLPLPCSGFVFRSWVKGIVPLPFQSVFDPCALVLLHPNTVRRAPAKKGNSHWFYASSSCSCVYPFIMSTRVFTIDPPLPVVCEQPCALPFSLNPRCFITPSRPDLRLHLVHPISSILGVVCTSYFVSLWYCHFIIDYRLVHLFGSALAVRFAWFSLTFYLLSLFRLLLLF